MNVDYPYRFDERGRSAEPGEADHVRDLIEQVLFTSPGERVNRPTFGCGLREAVFRPNSAELAATTQFLIQGALQEWLGDVITVEEVEVVNDEERLRVTVRYSIRSSEEIETAEFVR
jgi:uncharacterized protein